MTLLRLASREAGVGVLGPGLRLVWWTQGCSLQPRCRGCMSPQTWDPLGGRTSTVDDELAWAQAMLAEDPTISGATLAGGEPTDQGPAIVELATRLRVLRPEAPLDLLLFSGRTRRVLARRLPGLLEDALVDVAILGRYLPEQAQDVPLVASANQELVVLTELGAARWAAHPPGGLELRLRGDRLVVVGVPAPGELEEVERLAGVQPITAARQRRR